LVTDLTVEFVVTDAATGEPIQGAELLILSYGGLNDDGHRLAREKLEREDLKLTTDDGGSASYICRGSLCFGRSSLFRNTYWVHLPSWYVTVKRAGYLPNETFFLDELPHRRAVKQVGPQQAKVVVPLALHKSRP
jgi:hypothetical protein